MGSLSLLRVHPCGRILVSVPGEFTNWMQNGGSPFLNWPHAGSPFLPRRCLLSSEFMFIALGGSRLILCWLHERRRLRLCVVIPGRHLLARCPPCSDGKQGDRATRNSTPASHPSGSWDVRSQVCPGEPGAVSASGRLVSWLSLGLRCIATFFFFSPLGSLALCNTQRFSTPATHRNQQHGSNCCLIPP